MNNENVRFIGGCKFLHNPVRGQEPHQCEFVYVEFNWVYHLCIWTVNPDTGVAGIIRCDSSAEAMELFRHCQGPLRTISAAEIPSNVEIEKM